MPGSSPLARGLRTGRCPTRRWCRDHPRSRGVYSFEATGEPGKEGSSPLARGLPSPGWVVPAHGGIIPARAGFTTSRRPRTRRTPDHPRSRGVYVVVSAGDSPLAGSSPLARGLPVLVAESGGCVRIIPARAGFTGPFRRAEEWRPDHPRSRGVYGHLVLAGHQHLGSSPLARGLHDRVDQHVRVPRIIPARAGFTDRTAAPAMMSADHPRSRGVYGLNPGPEGGGPGSSPLARGLHRVSQCMMAPFRIIPARAGFTSVTSFRWLFRTDHPRSRGVYFPCQGRPCAGSGSSPLARGLRLDPLDVRPRHGIIPARAGFTGTVSYLMTRHGDHPRSRGVYGAVAQAAMIRQGSSPLARGLLRG